MIKKKRKINKNRKGIKKNNNNNNKKEIIEIRNTKRNIIGQSMGKIRIVINHNNNNNKRQNKRNR